VVEKAETALETQADGVVVRANIETLRGRLKLALIAVS
jgi:hypothetical protein